jgi:hypothetical protein
MAKEQPPSWLSVVQKVERTIGEPVEKWVRSDAYFDVLTQATRARGQWTRAVQEIQREWLHFFNLPTNSDVTALREQLSRVERRLAEIGKDIEDLDHNGGHGDPEGHADVDPEGDADGDPEGDPEGDAEGDLEGDADGNRKQPE